MSAMLLALIFPRAQRASTYDISTERNVWLQSALRSFAIVCDYMETGLFAIVCDPRSSAIIWKPAFKVNCRNFTERSRGKKLITPYLSRKIEVWRLKYALVWCWNLLVPAYHRRWSQWEYHLSNCEHMEHYSVKWGWKTSVLSAVFMAMTDTQGHSWPKSRRGVAFCLLAWANCYTWLTSSFNILVVTYLNK